jgi:hypothetical protein
VFKLKCKIKGDYNNWITELKAVILKSKGYRLNIHIFDSDFNVDFWRFAHIKEEEFLSDAETGDIVLFRGSHLGAKITRKWTNGSVDHAAMVIRLEKYDNQIFLLESVMVRGVSFVSFDFFKRTNKVYN